MLPGQFPNEPRLMIPDFDIAPQGFFEDLSATPSWPHRVSINSSGRRPLGDRAAPLQRLTYLRTCRDGSRWGSHVVPVICCRCRCLRFSVTPRIQWSPESRPLPQWCRTHLLGPQVCGTFCLNLLRSIRRARPSRASGVPDCPTRLVLHGSPGPVPRWCLAREGPFLSEQTPSALDCFGDGCSFRHTTYLSADYTRPTGEFGVQLHHPWFLEWVDTPESASLLDMGPGRWLHSLSREQAIDATHQLHRDVCLMTTNLDQYVLCLQGMAS